MVNLKTAKILLDHFSKPVSNVLDGEIFDMFNHDGEDGILGQTGVYGIYRKHSASLNQGQAFWGIVDQNLALRRDIGVVHAE